MYLWELLSYADDNEVLNTFEAKYREIGISLDYDFLHTPLFVLRIPNSVRWGRYQLHNESDENLQRRGLTINFDKNRHSCRMKKVKIWT